MWKKPSMGSKMKPINTFVAIPRTRNGLKSYIDFIHPCYGITLRIKEFAINKWRHLKSTVIGIKNKDWQKAEKSRANLDTKKIMMTWPSPVLPTQPFSVLQTAWKTESEIHISNPQKWTSRFTDKREENFLLKYISCFEGVSFLQCH